MKPLALAFTWTDAGDPAEQLRSLRALEGVGPIAYVAPNDKFLITGMGMAIFNGRT